MRSSWCHFNILAPIVLAPLGIFAIMKALLTTDGRAVWQLLGIGVAFLIWAALEYLGSRFRF